MNTCPVSDSGLTSLKPTVETVITVMYRASMRLHSSMIMKPAVPATITSSTIPVNLVKLRRALLALFALDLAVVETPYLRAG